MQDENRAVRQDVGNSLPLARPELFLTVFLSGAAVMVVEVMGTRIIGPVFGVGLFVWSALLTVTLSALAIGYYTGGRIADRFAGPHLLGYLAGISGALLGLVGFLSHIVLSAVEGLGPRWGALSGATLLFGPTLVVLGMMGPVAVREATKTSHLTGRSVGSMYAISTAGSVVGTLALVFALIPKFETDGIITGTAVVLVLLGVLTTARRGRSITVLAILGPAIGTAAPARQLPEGLSILARSQSTYGLVEVIEDTGRDVRFLRSDHSIIGAQYTRDGSAGFAFLHLLEAIRFLRPTATRALQIGLGIGSLPKSLAAEGLRFDSVEIDPSVVQFAQRYFGFAPNGDVFVEDARTYLNITERRYDIVVHDTFTGGATPEHLLSLEVLRRIKGVLRPRGVLALNFIGFHEGQHAGGSFAVARTVRSVFANMRVFRDAPLNEDPGEPGNLLFFASDGDLTFRIPAGARFENAVCEQVQRTFQEWEVLNHFPEGPLITDAKNPMSKLQAPVEERHFYAMKKLLPGRVWLP